MVCAVLILTSRSSAAAALIQGRSEAQELAQIGQQMHSEHKLSTAQIDFLIKVATEPGSSLPFFAVSNLMEAEKLHLFSKQRVLKLIQENMDHAVAERSMTWLELYERELDDTPVHYHKLSSMSEVNLYRIHPALDDYNAQERMFVTEVFKDPDGQQRLIAGPVLIRKNRLKPEALKWLDRVLNREIARGTPNQKEYWNTVKQVCHFKAKS